MLYQTEVILLAVRRSDSGGPEPASYTVGCLSSAVLQYTAWVDQYPGPPVGCRSAVRNWLSCHRMLGESRGCHVGYHDTGRVVNPLLRVGRAQSVSLHAVLVDDPSIS